MVFRKDVFAEADMCCFLEVAWACDVLLEQMLEKSRDVWEEYK